MLLAQLTNSPAWRFLVDGKDAIASAETCLKILGLFVVGWWTWMLYRRKRERFPRAKMTHRTDYWNISKDDRLLRVILVVENQSEVLLRVKEGSTWIRLLKPWCSDQLEEFKHNTTPREKEKDVPRQVSWKLLGEKLHKGHEIEPKETDEIAMDFIVPSWCEEVIIQSFIENSKKRRIRNFLIENVLRKERKPFGWNISSTLKFDTPDKPQQMPSGNGQQDLKEGAKTMEEQAEQDDRPTPAQKPTGGKEQTQRQKEQRPEPVKSPPPGKGKAKYGK